MFNEFKNAIKYIEESNSVKANQVLGLLASIIKELQLDNLEFEPSAKGVQSLQILSESVIDLVFKNEEALVNLGRDGYVNYIKNDFQKDLDKLNETKSIYSDIVEENNQIKKETESLDIELSKKKANLEILISDNKRKLKEINIIKTQLDKEKNRKEELINEKTQIKERFNKAQETLKEYQNENILDDEEEILQISKNYLKKWNNTNYRLENNQEIVKTFINEIETIENKVNETENSINEIRLLMKKIILDTEKKLLNNQES